MVFIFLMALIIFGPKKLPEIGKQIGRALNEFKRASNEFKSQIEQEISNLDLEQERQILPPANPPEGTLSQAPRQEPPARTAPSEVPEVNVAAKAPDA